MTVEELYNALPYTDRDNIQVVIATGNDKYGTAGYQVSIVLEDKANKAIILVADDIEKLPNITKGATEDE